MAIYFNVNVHKYPQNGFIFYKAYHLNQISQTVPFLTWHTSLSISTVIVYISLPSPYKLIPINLSLNPKLHYHCLYLSPMTHPFCPSIHFNFHCSIHLSHRHDELPTWMFGKCTILHTIPYTPLPLPFNYVISHTHFVHPSTSICTTASILNTCN